MSEPFRVAAFAGAFGCPVPTGAGGRIDRTTSLSFTFDGRRLHGCAGDTLASALLANGVHLVARSFKYHRPRGILTAGAEEPNALVTIDRGGGRLTPNLRATEVELYDGLVARSQNRWPALALDLGAVADLAAPLLSAGFYYKTFMGPRLPKPNWAWAKIYEPLIRRAAGLGRAPALPDPDHYASCFAHCDVLIVGAGPAGLAAALAASQSGARVILCDEQAEMGGSLLGDATASIDGVAAAQWIAESLATLRSREHVTLLPRTTAFGYFAQNFLGLAERVTDHLAQPDPARPRERLWQVRARHVVVATGAIERPLVFPENDRPGIMLADAARTYLNRYGVKPGRRAVVLTACDTAYQAALDLNRAGVEIALIADIRLSPHGPAIGAAAKAGLAIETSTTLNGTTGRRRVASVEVGHILSGGTVGRGRNIACDVVLMSGGWTPSVHLFSQSRGKLAWSDAANAYLPAESRQALHCAGASAGVDGLAEALGHGYAAGGAAVHAATGASVPPRWFDATEPEMGRAGMIGALPTPRPGARAFVDFQNDVTAKDLVQATREGFRAIEHVKRYTTTGMATDQGKTSNINALAVVADALGKTVPEVGLTTFRQPYTPVTFGTLAGTSRGDLFDPVRRTPIDVFAQANGACFEDVGQWKRARYFPRPTEIARRIPGPTAAYLYSPGPLEAMHAAVIRECRTVRSAVGILDASTLGKIEVVGPDAAEFLERMYVNSFANLAVGRCRYGILLNEAGFIIDDGVIGRLAPDRFHVTTTTSGAARVLNMMEDYLQTEFTELQCWLTSTTEQWAVIAVQGPRARDVLAPLVAGIDLASAAFPHMAVREATICGVEARIFRVSFTGELGFEVNVPADYGRAVWDAIWGEVRLYGGTAYGTEAMHVLRAEKGYIIVGQETDGTVTPDDAGLAWAIGKNKRDFVGKRSLTRPDMVKAGRKQLVGLRTLDPKTVLEDGAQIVDVEKPPAGTPALGHVTSSYWSPTLDRSIALALIADGRKRMGEKLFVPMPEGSIAVEVVAPVFVDPKGERLHG